MKIFCDVDGVLSNFVLGASRLFNQDYEELLKRWPRGHYDMEDVLGISRDAFFDTISATGEHFWTTLPAYDHAREFYDFCTNLGPTYILSAPTRDPGSLAGKVRWLQNMFGPKFRNYVITMNKELCARETHVLIDDHEVNVKKFRSHDGHAVLWPTLHNSRHAESHVALEVAKAELEEACRLIKSHGIRKQERHS